MSLRDRIEACVDRGVTERPPVAGVTYRAFVVHTRKPDSVTVAIAHYEAGHGYVIDLVREGLSIVDAAVIVKRYCIDEVTGADGDPDTNLAHAVCGVVDVLRKRGAS